MPPKAKGPIHDGRVTIKKVPTPSVNPTLQGRLSAGQNPVNVAAGGEGEFPVDCPVHIEVERVSAPFKTEYGETLGLLGHRLHLDFYTKGVGAGTHVVISMIRDPNALRIDVDGEEVYRWVINDSDLPVKTAEVLAEQARLDQEFARQADLRSGDFVEEGDEPGTIVITREVDDDELLFEGDPQDDEIIDDIGVFLDDPDDDELLFEDDDDFIDEELN